VGPIVGSVPDTPRVRWICVGLVFVALAGCGNSGKHLPAACTDGPLAFERALQSAPQPVLVNGTRISDCFTRNASAEDVQVVGTYLLTAAQELSSRAQQGNAHSAIALGYLIGAAQRGAERNDVSSEMVRRLQAEAAVGSGQNPELNRGLRAGMATG
jgi:hypothetical protein